MKYYLDASSLKQFNLVIACFKRFVLKGDQQATLPVQFQTEDENVGFFGTNWLAASAKKVVLYRYNQTSYSPHNWYTPVTIIPIRNAIQAICTYQSSRQSRYLGGGHQYDSTNLVCEQLKQWLSQLSLRELTHAGQIKEEIARYMAYLKSLVSENVFPVSRAGIHYERTMNSTLTEAGHCLQQTIAEIDELEKKRSLRDVIGDLGVGLKNSVDSSIKYLFYILRSEKTPAAICMEDIHRPCKQDIQDCRHSRSFKLLQVLVRTASVAQISKLESDGDSCTFLNSDPLYLNKDFATDNLHNSQAARRNHPLNRLIGGNLIPDRSRCRRWFGGVHSGISGDFQADYRLLHHFVKLHELTEKLALFTLICHDLEELVDFFGAKIWAELGQKILANFQESYRRLVNEFRQVMQDVHDQTSSHYRHLLNSGCSKKAWLQNFNTADRLKSSLMHDLEHSTERLSRLPVIIDNLCSPAYEQRIRDKFQHVITSLNQFGRFFEVAPIALVNANIPKVADSDYCAPKSSVVH